MTIQTTRNNKTLSQKIKINNNRQVQKEKRSNRNKYK